MKKILFIIYFWAICGSAYAQTNQVLYLIFDPNTISVYKNINKYILWNDDTEPTINELGSIKLEGNRGYLFTYPLYAGTDLCLRKKANTTVQVIPISQVANYNAKTIEQLDTDMQALVEYDFNHVVHWPWERETAKFFHNLTAFYVIELLPATQQAVIVEVYLDSKL